MDKVGRMAMLATAMALGGCVSHSGVRPLRPLEIATAPYQQVATTALTGSLMYEGQCLLFRDEQSGALLMPVWPDGSTFNGTAVLFHQPGKADQRVMVAEEFRMDGQPLQWTTLLGETYEPFQRVCGMPPFFVSRIRPAD
jgi:hypothetical protein